MVKILEVRRRTWCFDTLSLVGVFC